MSDIREQIALTTAAKTQSRLDAMQWDTTYFDRIVPRRDWAQLAGSVVRPAFDEFINLSTGSWRCEVVEATKIRLSFEGASSIGTYLPEGGAIRFSSIFGMVSAPTANDPFCALFYNNVAERAFWVTELWNGDVRVDPVALAELTTDGILTKAHAFAERLLSWEQKHPPVAIGFDPYPRYGIAA